MRWTVAAIAAAAVIAPTGSWAAQQGTPTESPRHAVVAPAPLRITVDGALDEESWQDAPTIGELTQREPHPGEPPTERTEVRLLHDEDALYIGVMAYDSEPDRIIGTEMSRDGALRSEDRVEVLLDTYGDQRNAFYFATNPSGALVDGLVFANGQSNLEWDAIWEVRTRRTAQGWSPSSRSRSRV